MAEKISCVSPDEKIGALAEIAARYAELGKSDEADGAMSAILEVCKAAASKSYVSSETRDRVIDLLLQSKKFDWALEAAGVVEDRERIDALVKIAGGLAGKGMQEKAAQVLSSAVDAMPLVDYVPDRPAALVAIASAYAKAGKKEKAVELLSGAVEESKPLDAEYQAPEALAAVAGGYAEAGRYDKALETVALIRSRKFQCRALAAMGAVQNTTGAELDEKATVLLQTIIK
jgi:tetratricopeptide (TPR) repeat protein